MQATKEKRFKSPRAKQIDPRRNLKYRGRRPQSQVAGRNSALTRSLLGAGFLLGSSLFLGYALQQDGSSVNAQTLTAATEKTQSPVKQSQTEQVQDRKSSPTEDLGVTEGLKRIASLVDTNDFAEALVQLEDISEKKHSPAQREQFRMLEQKAQDGFAMLNELRRRIVASPGQLVEIFEGRFRKIVHAGNQGISFKRHDRPDARSRSMAWNQLSPRGLVALALAYKVDRKYDSELRVYLADHHLVLSGQTVRTEEEDRSYREALAKTQTDSKEMVTSIPSPETLPPASVRPTRYDNGMELKRPETRSEEVAVRNRSDEKSPQPIVPSKKEEKPEIAVKPQEKSSDKQASNSKKKNLVFFRGKWISKKKMRVLEDTVISVRSENSRTFSSHRIQISKPESDKWAFRDGRMDTEIFSLEKKEKGELRVKITAHFYYFNTYYTFPGQAKTGGDNPSGLLKRHVTQIQYALPNMKIRQKMRKDLFHKDMHPFRTVLADKAGRTIEIFSVPSNQKDADRTFVFIVEYSPGEFKYSRYGVESIMKSFKATDKGKKSWAPGNKPKKYISRNGVRYERSGTKYIPVK